MIAFDLDGVIANIDPVINKGFARTLGVKLPSNPPNYHITIPGYDDATIGGFIDRFIYEGSVSGEIEQEPHAYDALARIFEMTKLPIYIITARNESTLGAVTRKWVSDFMKKLPYTVYFSGGASKSTFIPPGCRFFVDDKPENIQDLSRYLEMIFAIRKSYNEHIDQIPNVVRVSNLLSVSDIIDYKINSDAIKIRQGGRYNP